jgi:hypothetical protein
MKNKSQISIFVIIGLVIIIIISGFLFFNDSLPLISKKDNIANIVIYTETCIEQIATDGIFMQRMQGGYINIPEIILLRKAYVEAGGFKVPNWFYKGSSYKPTILRMEEELADYIDDNLLRCLNFYIPFVNKYDITFQELPTTNVKISNNKVSLNTNFPIEIKKKGIDEIYYHNEFITELKTDLGKLYNLASELDSYENTEAFLEFYTDEMIAASDYLPYNGLELDCKPKYFYEREMKEYTKQLIIHNLKYLQFLNTNYKESGYPYYDKIYKVDFTRNNYKDYNINILYHPNWNMLFKAVPSDNGVVKPHEFKAFNFFSVCMKVYHTRYTIEYPVLFQLLNEDNMDSFFYFSTPVLMRRNMPNRYSEVIPWDIELLDSETNDPYCDLTTNVTNYYLGQNNVMLTNPAIRNNRENKLNVYAVDWFYGYPGGVLNNVTIHYQCVKSKCEIGKTSFVSVDNLLMFNSLPHLNTGFPECENGIIIAQKDGYHQAITYQSVNEQTDNEQVTIEMYKLKELKFNVKVLDESFGLLQERNLRNGESAIIIIKNDELRFEKQLFFPIDENLEFNNLELLIADVDYDLEILLTHGSYLVGGSNLNWTVNAEDVFSLNNVEFYVYKKSPNVVTYDPEELYQLYETSLNESIDYPPRLY